MAGIEVDPSKVQSIEVDPSQVSLHAPKTALDHVTNFAKNFWGELVNSGEGLVNAVKDPIGTVKGIGAAQDAVRLKAQDAMKRGDYVEAARHAIHYLIPVAGPGIDARGDQAQAGDVSGALGGATSIGLQMALPGALKANVATIVPNVEKAAVATRGAAGGAARELVSRRTLGEAGAEYLANKAGLPPGVTTAALAGPRIVKGAISGARTALTDRLTAAADALAQQVAESAANPIVENRILRTPVNPPAPEVAAVPEAAAPRVPLRPPVAQPPAPPMNPVDIGRRILETPDATPAQAVEAFNALRELSARTGQPLEALYQKYTGEPLRGAPAAPQAIETPAPAVAPAPRTLAQNEAAMMQKAPPPVDVAAARAPVLDSGELKSKPLRTEDIINLNADAKAQRWAQALHEAGITTQDIRQIPAGRLTPEQIQKGGMPGWGNVTDSLVESGFLKQGELPPNRSLPMILKHIKTLEQAKKAAPAVESAAPAVNAEVPAALAQNPRALEIARQLQQEMQNPSAGSAPVAQAEAPAPASPRKAPNTTQAAKIAADLKAEMERSGTIEAARPAAKRAARK